MALLSLLNINLSFGGPAVLENLNFQVDPGERVCLLGRNGAGKTTLMRVIAGEMQPDSGDVFRPGGAVYTRLTQEIPVDLHGTVHDILRRPAANTITTRRNGNVTCASRTSSRMWPCRPRRNSKNSPAA